jgi:serine/threonine-protein kinase
MLADFGTARRLGEPSPPGSPGYVSPERLAGRASDPGDDVYGFGRVLAEVLDVGAAGARDSTGAPAVEGGDGVWRALAAECLAPGDVRPRDGAALVRKIEALREPLASANRR